MTCSKEGGWRPRCNMGWLGPAGQEQRPCGWWRLPSPSQGVSPSKSPSQRCLQEVCETWSSSEEWVGPLYTYWYLGFIKLVQRSVAHHIPIRHHLYLHMNIGTIINNHKQSQFWTNYIFFIGWRNKTMNGSYSDDISIKMLKIKMLTHILSCLAWV